MEKFRWKHYIYTQKRIRIIKRRTKFWCTQNRLNFNGWERKIIYQSTKRNTVCKIFVNIFSRKRKPVIPDWTLSLRLCRRMAVVSPQRPGSNLKIIEDSTVPMQRLNFLARISAVDPWHFDTDPDPRVGNSDQWSRIHRIRYCYFRPWPSKSQQKIIFISNFSACYFLKVHLHHFSKIKRHKEVIKQYESSFFWLFCLMIGSGSRRPKSISYTDPDPQHQNTIEQYCSFDSMCAIKSADHINCMGTVRVAVKIVSLNDKILNIKLYIYHTLIAACKNSRV